MDPMSHIQSSILILLDMLISTLLCDCGYAKVHVAIILLLVQMLLLGLGRTMIIWHLMGLTVLMEAVTVL
jgi:hypothetical protein